MGRNCSWEEFPEKKSDDSTISCPHCDEDISVMTVRVTCYCPECGGRVRVGKVFPRYEVITFSRAGKDWFSVKDFELDEVYTLSWDEWLAHVDRFKEEGLRHGDVRRGE